MKGLHWSCRMQKRKFPMIVIRVASPHFLSAPAPGGHLCYGYSSAGGSCHGNRWEDQER